MAISQRAQQVLNKIDRGRPREQAAIEGIGEPIGTYMWIESGFDLDVFTEVATEYKRSIAGVINAKEPNNPKPVSRRVRPESEEAL